MKIWIDAAAIGCVTGLLMLRGAIAVGLIKAANKKEVLTHG